MSFYLEALKEIRKLRSYHSDDKEAMNRLKEFVSYSRAGQTGNGQVSDQEREELIRWVVKYADVPGPIVEIGTLLGYSTEALCEGVLKSGVKKTIITVDNYGWNPMGVPSYRHKMLTRLNLTFASRLTDLVIVDAVAEEFYRSFDQVPSFVFIDADHTYASVKKDLQYFKDIGAKVITGHDYNFPDVCRAVKEVLGEEHLTVFGGTLFLYTTL